MACVCVSTDMCTAWDKTGRADFIKLCKSFIQSDKESTSISTHRSNKDIKRALYELCWHTLKNNLKVDKAYTAVAEVVGLHQDVSSTLADIFAVIDSETQCAEDKVLRENFITLVNSFLPLIPEKVVKERLDVEALADIGIIKNKGTFHTKFIKIKTKLYYKQQKFNLLREESEGYAKLITELNQELRGSVTAEYILEVIKSLIGCFNLDPNRVLDIILESFENRPELHEFFIPLLKSYMCDQNTLCEVLGFKFDQELKNRDHSDSLYKVSSLMLQYGLIPLDALYALLKPKDSEMYEMHKLELQEAYAYTRKLNVVSTLGEKPSDSADESVPGLDDKYMTNQKLRLCEALLKIGDWQHAKVVLSRMPNYFATSYESIRDALCKLIHSVVENLYRQTCSLSKFVKGRPVDRFANRFFPKAVESLSELHADVFPMLLALGSQLSSDPVLLVKMIRLAKAYMLQQKPTAKYPPKTSSNDPENAEYYGWLQIVDEVLLPSLSLLECNCCIAEELWGLLKLYPYQYRYYLYGQWKNETYLTHPMLIKGRADALKRIRYIMKRLSKENVKPSGRHIGKLSHSNPGFLFDYILSQIQAWNNLIVPVVDSLKYLTNLSYDVLAYCIIEALANPEKQRMKHDQTSISLWLQSLSNFCGAIFKKYSIELTGLLQYVANQLKAEKSLDLLILKEIVQKMAGIEALEEMTDDQLEAMAGGELLKAEGGYFSLVRNTKKSSQRLKEALLEQELAIPLCLLMAQQRNCVIYKEQESGHVKLVGKLYDQCQDTLVQFGSFLATNLSMEDYVSRLPSIDALMSEYHIMADVAFFLSRPMFTYAIASKLDEMRKVDKSSKGSSSQVQPQKYLEIVEDIMQSIMDTVRPLQSNKVWEDISPQFYVTFWSLTMYDLHVPASSYDKEVLKLKGQIGQIEENKDMAPSKKKKEVDRCKALIDKMQDEQKRQRDHCDRVKMRLKNEKDQWFLSRSAKNETITQFLQLCVFPRCTFTAIDAIYCAKFVHTIHNLKTPNFSTLICYDRIFCDITYTVTSCTENEANRYGRFLCAMLETVMRWHSDKSIFDKECANYPGFVTKFRVANQSTENASDHVDYENYRHVCHKWHFKITKAMVTCLASGDYVQIRNSLLILIKILPFYPVMSTLAGVIENRIKTVRDNEKQPRPDLYALALGYLGQLKTRKSFLINEHEFHIKETKDNKSQATNAAKIDVSGKVHASSQNSVNSSSGGNSKSGNEQLEGTKEPTKESRDRRVASSGKGEMRLLSKGSSGVGTSNAASSVKRDLASVKVEHEHERVVFHERSSERTRIGDQKEDKYSAANSSKDDHIHQREEKFARQDERTRSEKMGNARDEPAKDKSHLREERHAKEEAQDRTERSSSVSSSNSGTLRQSVEPGETDRENKRRKMDHPVRSGKTPRHDDKNKDAEKEKSKSEKSREKSRSREPERESKQKEKKLERKRDRLEEQGNGVDVKRRKDESLAKITSRQNGEAEREKEHHKKESSGEKERFRERKGEGKEEKKHHRSLSRGAAKKR